MRQKQFSVLITIVFVLGLVPWTLRPAPTGAAPVSRQEACGDPATPIHALQGTDLRSPEVRQKHTIEGVVVADFQDTLMELGGFFLQEEDADADADPATSEGIFVFDDNFGVDVQTGDVVRVAGMVMEIDSSNVTMTQLRRITAVTVCDTGASVTPTEITLPVPAVERWEQVEGMLVTLPQEMTVTENYSLGRYGEVQLAYGGRMYIPTNVAAPGEAASAVMAENDQRRIILDDGSNVSNPDPVPYPTGGLSAENTLRPGDSVTNITGVVEHSFGEYRIHPVAPPSFAAVNLRPTW
jgi:predicted extracellular nuclease